MVKPNSIGFVKRLSWLTIALIAFTSVGFCFKQYRCYDILTIEIFKKKFTEPFEVLYLVATDWTMYRVTSNDEYRIEFSYRDLKDRMARNNHDITDIMVAIHNHLPHTTRKFTKEDIHAWNIFKDDGFKGNFYLFIQGFNIIYELREE